MMVHFVSLSSPRHQAGTGQKEMCSRIVEVVLRRGVAGKKRVFF